MDQTGTKRVEPELTGPWAELVFQPGDGSRSAPARPSAPRPSPQLQAFSATPLAAARPRVDAGRRLLRLGAASVAGLVLLGAIALGARAALRTESPKELAAPNQNGKRVQAIRRGLINQRAAATAETTRPGATHARGPARAKGVAATPKAAARPQAAPVSSKPRAEPRASKFADEPADPDAEGDLKRPPLD